LAEFEVRPITAVETRPLRHAVLRPHQAPEELVYPGDDMPESLHVGGFAGCRLVGVATVVPGPMPGVPDESAWQVRGMATLPEFRGRGLGKAMLGALVTHVAGQNGKVIWCNARTPAVGFYRKLGFETRGGEFLIPVSGPHYMMWRGLPPKTG
jgi:ribosomal protein S18 acetylase RimI-like enzyme